MRKSAAPLVTNLPVEAQSKIPKLLAIVAAVALLIIYVPGLSNGLIFDDFLLRNPDFFTVYEWPRWLQSRGVAYASFGWVRELAGTSWEAQRLVNLLIHALNCLLLYWLLSRLLGSKLSAQLAGDKPAHEATLVVAVAWFALNPVATYSVAYLIQRSSLMATSFSLLALLGTLNFFKTRKPSYAVLAFMLFAIAVLCKEYAVTTIAAALGLWIYAERPPKKQIGLAVVALAMVTIAVCLILRTELGLEFGGSSVEASPAYRQQLFKWFPETESSLWPYSALNQSRMFFEYVWRWFVPLPAFLSIDLRPSFANASTLFLHAFTAVAFAVLWSGSLALLVESRRDVHRLLGLCFFVICSQFFTEFALVWVQDSLVLYRSYFWFFSFPIVIYLLLRWLPRWAMLACSMLLCIAFTAGSVDRVRSMNSPLTVWADAVAKLPAEPTVGQFRPYLNMGLGLLAAGRAEEARVSFTRSAQLGDGGEGDTNLAQLHLRAGQFYEALIALDRAKSRGQDGVALHLNTASALLALAKPEAAVTSLTNALTRSALPVEKSALYAQRALVLVELRRGEEAQLDADAAVKLDSSNANAHLARAFATLLNRRFEAAQIAFDRARELSPPTAKTLVIQATNRLALSDRLGAAEDAEKALSMEPTLAEAVELKRRLSP